MHYYTVFTSITQQQKHSEVVIASRQAMLPQHFIHTYSKRFWSLTRSMVYLIPERYALCLLQLFDNERELRRIAVLAPGDRTLAAAARERAWCVEKLFAKGCPVNCTQVSPVVQCGRSGALEDAEPFLPVWSEVHNNRLSRAHPALLPQIRDSAASSDF